jgi:hypothetical protein
MAGARSVALIALLGALLLAAPPAAMSVAAYPSVAAAVAALPELSTLNGNLQGTSLTQQFSDPSFVATVFLPANDALDSLSSQARGLHGGPRCERRERPAARAAVHARRHRRGSDGACAPRLRAPARHSPPLALPPPTTPCRPTTPRPPPPAGGRRLFGPRLEQPRPGQRGVWLQRRPRRRAAQPRPQGRHDPQDPERRHAHRHQGQVRAGACGVSARAARTACPGGRPRASDHSCVLPCPGAPRCH